MKLRASAAITACALLGACAAKGGNNTPPHGRFSDAAPGTIAYDRDVFSALLANHESIRRTVTVRPDGVSTLTESDDPEIAERLRVHVAAMKARLEGGHRLRQWDPIYVAVFDDAPKVSLAFEPTPAGIRVTETSTDPRTIRLIQAHASVVSGFVAHGFDEAGKAHAVPADAP